MLVNQLLDKVTAVLDSKYSNYAIAKGIGDKSANYIANLRSGKSRLTDIKLEKLEKLEKFYEEEVKMTVEILNVTDDYVEFACKVCGKEQTIVSDHDHVQEMAKEIESGINPFEDGWEDGIGNTVVCDCE